MQYKIGTVNLVNGSNAVTGNSTVFQGNVTVGDSFKVQGENAIYQVIAVDLVLQQISLAPAYAGATQTGVRYQVMRDRTPNLGLAEINPGDEDWPYWLTNEVIRKLDVTVSSNPVTEVNVISALGFTPVNPLNDPRHPNYGAVGDGVTDDTAALIRFAAYIQTTGRGTIDLGNGKYLVRGSGNTFSLMAFSNMDSLSITGNGAQLITDDFSTTALPISGFTFDSGTGLITATTPTAHGLSSGTQITIYNTNQPEYTGTYSLAPTGTNTFTYTPDSHPTVNTATSGVYQIPNIGRTFIHLNNCSNVRINGIAFFGTVLPIIAQRRIGWNAIMAQNGGHDYDIDIKAQGLSYGLASGTYGQDLAGLVSKIRMNISTVDVGYPVALWRSGDNSSFNIIAERPHRVAYITGSNGVDVIAKAKDFDVSGVLVSAHLGNNNMLWGSSNINITMIDTGTTQPVSNNPTGFRPLVFISGYSGSGTALMSNIAATVAYTAFPGAKVVPFEIYSYANFTYKNISLSGSIDRSALLDNQTTFLADWGYSSGGVGTWINQTVHDLKVINPTGIPVGVYANFGNLTGNFTFTDCLDNNPWHNITIGNVGPQVVNNTGVLTDTRKIQAAPMGGVQFDGNVGSRISFLNKSTIGTSDFTLWLRTRLASPLVPTTYQDMCALSSNISSSQDFFMPVSITSTGFLQVMMEGSRAVPDSLRMTTSLNLLSLYSGQVVDIAIVRSAGTLTMYLNGQILTYTSAVTGTNPGIGMSINGTYSLLGCGYSGYPYAGAILGYALINAALTSAAVENLSTSNGGVVDSSYNVMAGLDVGLGTVFGNYALPATPGNGVGVFTHLSPKLYATAAQGALAVSAVQPGTVSAAVSALLPCRTLIQRGDPVSLYGITGWASSPLAEYTLATYNLPGGTLGLNGGLEIEGALTTTNSANAKTVKVKLGTLILAAGGSALTTSAASTRLRATVINRNNQSLQYSFPQQLAPFGPTSTGPSVNGTQDTTADKSVSITGQTTLEAGFTPTAANMSGSGTIVTVIYTTHGLNTGEYVQAAGSSTSGYNADPVMITKVDANTFTYPATGSGTPTTAPTVKRYSAITLEMYSIKFIPGT